MYIHSLRKAIARDIPYAAIFIISTSIDENFEYDYTDNLQ